MSEKFTNKQLAHIKELERLAWNAALDAAEEAIQADDRAYYKDSIYACRSLHKRVP